MFARISRALDAITSFSLWLAALSLALCCLLILVEIVLRNFAHTTTGVSVEYSAYLLVFMVFAALAHTQRSGTMIYMEIAYDRYPPRARRVLDGLRWTVGLVFGVIAIWHLTTFTARTCALGQVSMFTSRTQLCGPQAVMVLGMTVLTLEFLRGSVLAWRSVVLGRDEEGPPAGADAAQKDVF